MKTYELQEQHLRPIKRLLEERQYLYHDPVTPDWENDTPANAAYREGLAVANEFAIVRPADYERWQSRFTSTTLLERLVTVLDGGVLAHFKSLLSVARLIEAHVAAGAGDSAAALERLAAAQALSDAAAADYEAVHGPRGERAVREGWIGPGEISDRIYPGVAEIGRRIRVARERAGLTQEALAAAVGINRPNLTALENGNRGIGLDVLRRIATRLDVTLNDLGW